MEYAELRDEVFALFAERLDPECWCYHSTVHTAFVLEDVLTFGRRAGVAAENLELLRIAALFHDTGFIFDPENHEAASAAFARERLSAAGMPAARVAQVERLILATRVPTAPADLLEAVICDADIGQMATGCFLWLGARLRRELARNGMPLEGIAPWQLGVGFGVSAVVGYAALALLVKMLNRGKLALFSWYLYAVGLCVLIWQLYKGL